MYDVNPETVPDRQYPLPMDANRRINPKALQARAEEASRLLKAMANPQRLRTLCLLVDRELTVGQLNGHLPELSQSAMSQHLARLRDEGLVETRRESQQIWYRLAAGPVQHLIESLHDIYCGSRGVRGGRPPAAHGRIARKA